ncbi:GreA/GreB family elongation factor [Euryhalocaulis caribicus]|uniref:GreA/GreB family elongation factor n=1 Tax=Euryhalocaulis caribicus TaxID=1161401 RepID=UPI0003B331B8|nr:GreA/GreB family elongation factor [Euryhalocaulis caribicus]
MGIQEIHKPEIFVTAGDYDLLEKLVPANEAHSIGVRLFADELDRAEIVSVENGDVFVMLNSKVCFKDRSSGRTRTVFLTLPKEANADSGKVSVLSPVGAALLGLKEGDRFEWVDDSDRLHQLEILSIAPMKV